eukprot:c10321_g1_i1.p1 GENE.c10321_g1_i1~~c10321_g1_i1.p1  ORF type:complete len:1042 (+),score=295.58 c10321_g1_i1:99-3128(+)
MDIVEEALYNRQLYVLGREAMLKMKDSNVAILNIGGLGVEIAKNILLAGVKSLEIFDVHPVSENDLSSQFFFCEEDIDKPRVEVATPKLAELNQYVAVSGHNTPFTPSHLARFQVVVACDLFLSEQLEIDNFCHANGICFVAANTHGVFGSVFCDFGLSFVVNDKNGEQPGSALVASISQENPGVVTVLEDSPHNLEDGDHVEFQSIRGMTQLNNAPPQPVKVIGSYAFSIGDTSSFGTYSGGGRVLQVKQSVTLTFKPLSTAISSPDFIVTDFAKIGRPELLHKCAQALDAFVKKFNRLPQPANGQDAAELASAVEAIAASPLSDQDRHVVHLFAHCATGNLNPTAAFIGGVAAQEALKACTGKFTPIHQFLYFDAIESLPDNVLQLPAESFIAPPALRRYQGQISVIGNELQERLMNLKYFVVGAGAIGCEMLKNLAMMGVGCGPEGHVTVTDMDKIERSNLSRQFLFRSSHIDMPKSSTACAAVKAMNPGLHIEAFETRVGPDTESTFGDSFFNVLDGVCNALDNIEARLYVDQRCVLFQKPLLESGTMGTKGNVQVIVPHVTESYGSSADPPEKGIPVCTLKHFPNKIEHTIQWARDEFEGLFANQPNDVNRYLTEPTFLQSLNNQRNIRDQILESIVANLVNSRPVTFEQCVEWARLKFEQLFNHSIHQLLHNFPLDTKDRNGNDFWSGNKNPPSPIAFDASIPLHLDFVIACSNLRAFNYGLQGRTDGMYFVNLLRGINVPAFKPVEGLHIPVSDKEAESISSLANVPTQSADSQAATLAKALPIPSSLAGFRLAPVSFEKDDDTNFHMKFITSTSNLRAHNYKIPESDFHETKRIAGKIIPAIATTTALVTGLVAFELLKVHQPPYKIERFKNGFVNLALPLFAFSEPIGPPKVTSAGRTWTLWDKTIVDNGDLTLREFISYFETSVGLEVNMVSYGRSILYSSFTPKKKLEERYGLRMSELAQTISKQPLLASACFLTLEVCCVDKTGNDIELPTVRFKFR